MCKTYGMIPPEKSVSQPQKIHLMIAANIISVNPSSPTEGSLHPESATLQKGFSLRSSVMHRHKKFHFANFMLAVSPATGIRQSLLQLLARAVLAVSAFWVAFSSSDPLVAISGYVLSGMIAIGLFSRWASLTIAGVMGYTAVTALMAGTILPFESLLALCALCVAFSGSGKISLDYVTRCVLSAVSRHRRRSRKIKSRIPLTYEAYRYVARNHVAL